MLYDPKWDQRTLLDQWIAWLETKEPSERYDWMYHRECPCGQFYGSVGWVSTPGFGVLNKIARGEPRDDCVSAFSNREDWTFGKCLERAKQYRGD